MSIKDLTNYIELKEDQKNEFIEYDPMQLIALRLNTIEEPVVATLISGEKLTWQLDAGLFEVFVVHVQPDSIFI